MDALKTINSKIMTLPNRPLFMLDSDVAGLYETETKYINQAVKRNAERFPVDFYFQLTDLEYKKLEKTGVNLEVPDCHLKNKGAKLEVTDCDLKFNYGGRRYRPFGFTREGCNMLAAVLNTSIAIERSIQIIRAFTALERLGTQKAASEEPDSPILPSGLQLVMLKDLYGSEGLKEILKIHYGISPGTPITGITELEAHTIRKTNPNQKQRNKMIADLVERGVPRRFVVHTSMLTRETIRKYHQQYYPKAAKKHDLT